MFNQEILDDLKSTLQRIEAKIAKRAPSDKLTRGYTTNKVSEYMSVLKNGKKYLKKLLNEDVEFWEKEETTADQKFEQMLSSLQDNLTQT